MFWSCEFYYMPADIDYSNLKTVAHYTFITWLEALLREIWEPPKGIAFAYCMT